MFDLNPCELVILNVFTENGNKTMELFLLCISCFKCTYFVIGPVHEMDVLKFNPLIINFMGEKNSQHYSLLSAKT